MPNGIYKHKPCSKETKKKISLSLKIHGMTGTRFWKCWKNMRNRCYDKNSTNFKYWGGRGIKVCKRGSSTSLNPKPRALFNVKGEQ